MSDVKPVLFSGPMIRALLDGQKTQTRRILKPQPPKGEYGDDYITRLNGPEWYEPAVVGKDGEIVPGKPIWGVYDDFGDFGARVPYMPGDLLWVRETWAIDEAVRSRGRYGRPDVYYLADRRPDVPSPDGFLTSAQLINMHLDSLRKRPAIHMPRWASRLTLEVTSVKVERLQEISADDALAEGVIRQDPTPEDEAWNRQWCEGEGIEADPLGPVWLAPGTRQGFGSHPNDPQWGPTPEFAFRLLWDGLYAKRGYGWETNPLVYAISFIVHQMNVDAFLAQREDTKEISSSSSSYGDQR